MARARKRAQGRAPDDCGAAEEVVPEDANGPDGENSKTVKQRSQFRFTYFFVWTKIY